MTYNNVYTLTTFDKKNVVFCSSIEVAKFAMGRMSKELRHAPKLKPISNQIILFDEGNPLALAKDRYFIRVNDFTFAFYFCDFSSLLFELARALKEDGCYVGLHSSIYGVLLHREEAETLFDFMYAKYNFFKSKESEWFENTEKSHSDTNVKANELN